jgi:hypothetical protein
MLYICEGKTYQLKAVILTNKRDHCFTLLPGENYILDDLQPFTRRKMKKNTNIFPEVYLYSREGKIL